MANLQYYPTGKMGMMVRLYPKPKAAKEIDKAIDLLRIISNNMLYDILSDEHLWTKERTNSKTGKTVRVFDSTAAGCADALRYYQKRDFRLNDIIPKSFYSNVFGVTNDLKKKFDKLTMLDNGRWYKPDGEEAKPKFYSKNHPRTSFGYQLTMKTCFDPHDGDCVYIRFPKEIGWVKSRGWDTSLRFGPDASQTFFEYAQEHPKQTVGVTVSHDNCDRYWCVIKLGKAVRKSGKATGIDTYKQYTEMPSDECGIDLGVSTAATVYNASTKEITKYENPGYAAKDSKHGGYKDKLAEYDRRIASAYGPKNPAFREDRKLGKQDGIMIWPSNNYKTRSLKKAKLSQKVKNKRDDFQHKATRKIIDQYSTIYVETLDIAGMLNRERAKAETGTNRAASTKNRNTADAAMSTFNMRLKYKSEWAGRRLAQIGQYERSTGVCPVCGHITPSRLPTCIRAWVCTECGAVNDRDGSAAEIIYQKGKLMDESST